jgi:hypothetical protein
MTISMLNLDLTPEEHQAVEAADVASFAGLTPASDPVALAILAKWAAASGYMELYDLVSFAPYFVAAAERRQGWDDLTFLASITAHPPGDSGIDVFREIVESQDEERREEAFAYDDVQLRRITAAMQAAGGELVEALASYRAEAAYEGGGAALSPEQAFEVPVVMEQAEQVPQTRTRSAPRSPASRPSASSSSQPTPRCPPCRSSLDTTGASGHDGTLAPAGDKT